MGKSRFKISRLSIWALLCTVLTPGAARAGVFYFEFGAGLARFNSNSGFFGSGFTSGSEFGVAINDGIFYSFGSAEQPVELQLGLADRYAAVREVGASYSFFSLYPTVRLQLSRLWLGVGYSPLTFVRAQPTGGAGDFLPAENGSALTFDAGVLFPITPFFSVGGSGGLQSFTSSSGTGTAFDVGLFLRFYMAFINGEKRNSGEFKGWRYPFGNSIN